MHAVYLQDWSYLLGSEHQSYVDSSCSSKSLSPGTVPNTLDSNALLAQHIPTLLFALHLVYEVRYVGSQAPFVLNIFYFREKDWVWHKT